MKIDLLINELKIELEKMSKTVQIETLNKIRLALHKVSPFSNEPIDCVLWKPIERVVSNDYNPNSVAPPEKRLLYTSLLRDGYTQPIVTSQQSPDDETHVIVDGFHRRELASKRPLLRTRVLGYLPVVMLKENAQEKTHLIAATIRHNRARGKHQISAMSDIVRELYHLGWDDEKISEELGMDADEVLRLKQISGLMELFQDREFSEAWTVK
ncbi:IbrB-like domain-containing protein [Hafnia alvei]|uniref:IbrB-like domain-containing protein n=1 Tax=Hafnia alvei TaxID=569 RepID=UPI004045148C